jgi:hypothetical protein
MSEVQYLPTAIPPSQESLSKYLEVELQRIAVAMTQSVRVPMFYEQPKNPEEGFLASADGVGWDPGAGAGLYLFTGGLWKSVSTLTI